MIESPELNPRKCAKSALPNPSEPSMAQRTLAAQDLVEVPEREIRDDEGGGKALDKGNGSVTRLPDFIHKVQVSLRLKDVVSNFANWHN